MNNCRIWNKLNYLTHNVSNVYTYICIYINLQEICKSNINWTLMIFNDFSTSTCLLVWFVIFFLQIPSDEQWVYKVKLTCICLFVCLFGRGHMLKSWWDQTQAPRLKSQYKHAGCIIWNTISPFLYLYFVLHIVCNL